jgi:hypothetical protein
MTVGNVINDLRSQLSVPLNSLKKIQHVAHSCRNADNQMITEKYKKNGQQVSQNDLIGWPDYCYRHFLHSHNLIGFSTQEHHSTDYSHPRWKKWGPAPHP